MLCARADWMALRRRGLPLGSPPPVFAAMVISFDNLLKILPRLASIAPLKRLTFDHLLCPAISWEKSLIITAAGQTLFARDSELESLDKETYRGGKLTRIFNRSRDVLSNRELWFFERQ